jgi:CrcB protein
VPIPLALYIALGSAAGGVTRYLVGLAIQQRATTAFPVSTLVINITGSLLLGFLVRYTMGSTTISPDVRAMLTTGFCGGYTTFSTFSFETVSLIQAGDWRRAFVYVTASAVLSIAACFVGFELGRRV